MSVTPCDGIVEGMKLDASCPTCGHFASDHTYPGAICLRCNDPVTHPLTDPALLAELNRDALAAIPAKWARPPKEMLSKLDRGKGVRLDYVGHADTTLMLIDVDPAFTYDYSRDERGRMDVYESGANLVLEGTLTVLGVTRPCVGTCEKRKVEIHKELLGDLLRNGAMRFGIATALWSKLDDATDAHYRGSNAEPQAPTPLSAENLGKFNAACKDAGIEPAAVMGKAFPSGQPEVLLDSHLPTMRDAFKTLKASVGKADPPPQGEDSRPSTPGDVDEAAALFDAEGIGTEVVEEILASDAQVKKIQVLMGEHGIKDRVGRLNFIKDALGLVDRPASTKNLTKDQAHKLIEMMEKGA